MLDILLVGIHDIYFWFRNSVDMGYITIMIVDGVCCDYDDISTIVFLRDTEMLRLLASTLSVNKMGKVFAPFRYKTGK